MKFYLTFGQKNTALRNGWIEVEAENYDAAVSLVTDVFGPYWSHLYSKGEFNKPWNQVVNPRRANVSDHFKLGKVGEMLK